MATSEQILQELRETRSELGDRMGRVEGEVSQMKGKLSVLEPLVTHRRKDSDPPPRPRVESAPDSQKSKDAVVGRWVRIAVWALGGIGTAGSGVAIAGNQMAETNKHQMQVQTANIEARVTDDVKNVQGQVSDVKKLLAKVVEQNERLTTAIEKQESMGSDRRPGDSDTRRSRRYPGGLPGRDGNGD